MLGTLVSRHVLISPSPHPINHTLSLLTTRNCYIYHLPLPLAPPLVYCQPHHPPAVGSLARLFECWLVITELDPLARWVTVHPTSRALATPPRAKPRWQCLFSRPLAMVTVKQYSASILESSEEQVAISFSISRTGMMSSAVSTVVVAMM